MSDSQTVSCWGYIIITFLLVVTKNVQKSKRTFVFVSTCIEIRKDGYIKAFLYNFDINLSKIKKKNSHGDLHAVVWSKDSITVGRKCLASNGWPETGKNTGTFSSASNYIILPSLSNHCFILIWLCLIFPCAISHAFINVCLQPDT